MNGTNAPNAVIEIVTSPLVPDFLLIQEISLIATLIFLIAVFRNMLMATAEHEHQQNSTPWFIIGALTALSFTSYLTYEWGFDRFLFALGFSLALTLTFARPVFGLCLFIAFLLYRPWEMMPEDQLVMAIPKVFGLLVFVTFLFDKFRKKEFFFIWNPETTFLILFAFWVFLSIFKTTNFNESVKLYEANFTKLIIIYFLIINVVKTKLDYLALKGTLVFAIIGKGIVSIYHTIMTYNSDPAVKLKFGERLAGIGALADPNDLAAVLMIGLPLMCSFFFTNNKKLLPKFVGIILVSFSLYLIWYSRSRGAIIALLVLAASFFWFKTRSKKIKTFAVVGLILLFFPLTMSFKRSASDLSESSSNRMNYWKTAVIMAIKNPSLGVGFNSYPENYEKYAPEILGEWGFRTAHSTWFLILAETGPLGLLFFGLTYFFIFRKSYRCKDQTPELFYALIGYSVTMTFLSHAYIIYPYILFALISAGNRVFHENITAA